MMGRADILLTPESEILFVLGSFLLLSNVSFTDCAFRCILLTTVSKPISESAGTETSAFIPVLELQKNCWQSQTVGTSTGGCCKFPAL